MIYGGLLQLLLLRDFIIMQSLLMILVDILGYIILNFNMISMVVLLSFKNWSKTKLIEKSKIFNVIMEENSPLIFLLTIWLNME